MTFKIKIFQFYDWSEPKQWNWNKISHFTLGHIQISYIFVKNVKVFPWLSKSKFLSIMTKVNPNNRNETKSDFLYGTYSTLTWLFIGRKTLKYFQFHCKSEHKQVTSKYLQSSTLFKWLLKTISWLRLLQKWMVTVL